MKRSKKKSIENDTFGNLIMFDSYSFVKKMTW